MERVKKYIATAGAQFDRKMAQQYGEYLYEVLPKRLGRAPTTEDIWKDARDNRRCPYRSFFEWNLKKAHVLYLNVQARNLVNHIAEVTIVGREPKICRSFFPILEKRGEPKRWIPIDIVRSEPSMIWQILESAARELRCWYDRYSLYGGIGRKAGSYVKKAIEVIEGRRKKGKK